MMPVTGTQIQDSQFRKIFSDFIEGFLQDGSHSLRRGTLQAFIKELFVESRPQIDFVVVVKAELSGLAVLNHRKEDFVLSQLMGALGGELNVISFFHSVNRGVSVL